jgi:NAD(P)-dependent dehydrogenase (short-subunit alcohol dehydrogenase family)
MAKKSTKKVNPGQTQNRPGSELKMNPQPISDGGLVFTEKLKNKILLITGGDSGIGRAVSILFARQGADVAIVYFNETEDASDTKAMIEKYGRKCLLIKGDIRKESFCKTAVKKTIDQFGKLDILINNAAIHYETKEAADIDMAKMKETFEVNIFAMFYFVKYSLPYLQKGAIIINTSSVTAYRGSEELIDYAATKGAIVSFTRSLAANLIKKGIRVNGVAPGPIWTPLIVASFDKKKVSEHGSKVPMLRAGEPAEVAPAYLFLASDDSSYITGQFIHPNGGEIVNG